MSGVSAEQVVLEVGKSAELVSALQIVAEAEFDGEPKFLPNVCRDLAKAIACRTYAKAVLELCHLVTVAEAVSGGLGYERLFWDTGVARPSAFRGYLMRQLRPLSATSRFALAEGAVEIRYPDGTFAVSFGRMPFLAALMEFLITTIGYREVDAPLRELLMVPQTTAAAVSQCANRVSKQLYDYLKEHLPTAQNQRKFRRLIGFLEERGGKNFGIEAIDDDLILEFWTVESLAGNGDGVDFRTFASVFKSFVRLRQTLEAAADHQALECPQSIGYDREAGEVDPDAILGMMETVEEYRSPLAALQDAPAAAIKFLNQRETAAVELLFDSGSAAFVLPLSLMRCDVFGKGQGQITQALRRKLTQAEIDGLVVAAAPETYAERRQALEAVARHVERALLASLHVLARKRNHEAIRLVMNLRPDADFRSLATVLEVPDEDEGNVVVLRAARVSERFLEVVEDTAKVGPEIAGLMGEARKAFRGLSRQGFGDAEADAPEIEDGFVEGSRSLIGIGEQIAAFTDRLDQAPLPAKDWETQFKADREVFSRQFGILYGGTV